MGREGGQWAVGREWREEGGMRWKDMWSGMRGRGGGGNSRQRVWDSEEEEMRRGGLTRRARRWRRGTVRGHLKHLEKGRVRELYY